MTDEPDREDFHYNWVVTTADGRILHHGFTRSEEAAIRAVKDAAGDLRAEGASGWSARVLDTYKPWIGNNPPSFGWQVVYFDHA